MKCIQKHNNNNKCIAYIILGGIMFKSLGSQIFFKNSILLEILERTLKWSKVTFIMLETISVSNKCYSFELSINQRILKCRMVSTNFFLFLILKIMFLENEIDKLEWFLKDHVTLQTGVMMLKNEFCHQRNKLHFNSFFIQFLFLTVLLFYSNITVFFLKNKCSFSEHETYLKNKQKIFWIYITIIVKY